MSVEPLGAMSIETLAALVGGFVVFLAILNIRTLRALRREADQNTHNEFKAHVRALMSKLDKMPAAGGAQAPRMRAVKRRGGKAVPASRTRPLSFPSHSSRRR